MPLENVTLFTGQAGNQMGNAIWELICAEHGVGCDGKVSQKDANMFKKMYGSSAESDACAGDAFFYRGPKNQFIPRTMFIDLEPSVLDEIRTGYYRDLFHPDFLVSGIEDASNIFARGYHSIGITQLPRVMERLRILIEECDSLSSLIFVHSSGGGCGSGFTSLIMDDMAEEFRKITKIECVIFPSANFSVNMVEPYNALLSAHYSMDNVDVSFLCDNEGLYNAAARKLDVHSPNYSIVNRLVSQVFCSMTASSRFGGMLTSNMTDYQTNLVPYPRIHFPVCSFSPMCSRSRADHTNRNIDSMTKAVFQNSNQFCTLDVEGNKYVSCVLMYRGTIPPGQIYSCINGLKGSGGLQFVDWCPTGVKVSICDVPPVAISQSLLAPCDRNVMLMSNTSALREPFERLLKKFELLYSKRSFVHWFVGEGMEEGEFQDATDNIETLIRDYNACFGAEEEDSKAENSSKRGSNEMEKDKPGRRRKSDEDKAQTAEHDQIEERNEGQENVEKTDISGHEESNEPLKNEKDESNIDANKMEEVEDDADEVVHHEDENENENVEVQLDDKESEDDENEMEIDMNNPNQNVSNSCMNLDDVLSNTGAYTSTDDEELQVNSTLYNSYLSFLFGMGPLFMKNSTNEYRKRA